MRFTSLCLAATLLTASTTCFVKAETPGTCQAGTCESVEAPFVTARITLQGEVSEVIKSSKDIDTITLSPVQACCGINTNLENENSQVFQLETIGEMPQMNEQQTLKVLDDAQRAWNGGMGTWPQMTLKERIAIVEKFLLELGQQRETIVNVLMWEIGKNRKDAESEFDRTIQFCRQIIEVIQTDPEFSGGWQTIGSTKAFVRRAAVGITMCLGPMNYPLNETYATLIPALLMGNVAIMKIPTVGGLVHLLTMNAFARTFPPGTMNFISGRGRDTMPTLMKTGDIDALAFIGGSKAADDLIRQHPQPHRLKVFLQLEAKNMAIYLPDLFDASKGNELSRAVDEGVLGALSFNGQRCTALKIFFVPKDHVESFVDLMVQRVEGKTVGLPWQTWPESEGVKVSYSSITPLPGKKRLDYMKQLINDAVSKGAKIMNEGGGEVIGGSESTLMIPAVLYPVTPEMDIYHEEQFGPIVPIATYDSLDTVLDYGREGSYGQQVSIFLGDQDAEVASNLLDKFSTIFGKININSQCGRSPDTLPFSGRRSSAMGVMSVKDALKEFSIPTVVSYKDNSVDPELLHGLQTSSKFLETL